MWTSSSAAPSSRRTVELDLLIALGIKLGLLTALYGCFFCDSHKVNADPAATAAALLGSPQASP